VTFQPASTAAPPRWARSVDLCCLGLIVFAIIIGEWGGFRIRFGDARIAITSPYRVLALAGVLALLRHALAPAAPIYRDVPARFAAFRRRPDARAAWTVLLATRLTIILVGYFAVITLGYNKAQPVLRYDANEFGNLQARWDTNWYLSIATNGYAYRTTRVDVPQNIVFFPALPFAARLAGRLFGGSAVAYLLGTTIVVLVAFFVALTYLFRLARETVGDDDSARWAMWLLAAYPFALYYSAVYTESIFLVGAVGAFYHFRRQEWVRAAAWGLLVGLTRPNGCFLSIPLGLMAIAPWLPAWVNAGTQPRGSAAATPPNVTRTIVALAAAAAPGIGVLMYTAFIWRLTGDPIAWARGHAAWGREYGGLVPLAETYFDYVSNSGVYVVTRAMPYDTMNAIGAMFVLATAIPVWRRLGLAYAVFILVNMLPPLAAGGFMSTGRFSSVMFPAFIWLAAAVPTRHRPAWLATFMGAQAFCAALFYTWHQMT
jgi:hypothetical protein